jgi:hypothetical protein
VSPARIGRWSARRPWLAIALWLAFVVLAVGALALTGSTSLQSGVTGEAARAERMLTQHQGRPEQDRFAYRHSDTLTAGDPAFHGAIARVETSMEAALDGHVTTSVTAGGHSALVGGPIGRTRASHFAKAGAGKRRLHDGSAARKFQKRVSRRRAGQT